MLLTVARLDRIVGVTADGLPHYAGLVASNLVCLVRDFQETTADGHVGSWHLGLGNYAASLTEKGRLFIEAWKKGDQRAAIELIPSGETTIEKKETDHAD